MGAAYITYTLLTLITFHSGHREMILDSGYPKSVCERKADEDNANWRYLGDHDTFASVKSVCIPSGKLP